MELADEVRDGVLVVQVRDSRIDASRATLFKDEINKRTDMSQMKLVLDLTLVELIDSIGLGALVSCFKHMGGKGKLVIVGAKGAVRRLLNLTRMDKVFPLYPTIDEAVASEAP